MSFAAWSLFVGVLLVTMVLAGTLLGRLPLSSAMVYLGLHYPKSGGVGRPPIGVPRMLRCTSCSSGTA